MAKYQVISIGGATRDIMFYTSEGLLIKNPKDLTRQKLLGFEYGAKIKTEKVFFTLGGGACNTAVGLSRLGLKVANIISIGNDREGNAILSDLKDEGVTSKFIQKTEEDSTGFSFFAIDERTKEHVAFLYRGANNHLKLNEKMLSKAKPLWFYVSSLTGKTWWQNSKTILKFLKESNTKLAWNPGETQLKGGYRALAPLIKATEVLILNKDESIELVLSANKKVKGINNPRVLVKAVRNLGSKMTLLSNGKKGAYVYDGEKIYYTKIAPAPVEDTTGAGDCFGSSFVAGLIKFKGDIDRALKLGILNTASLVQKTGAQEGLAYWKNLRKRF